MDFVGEFITILSWSIYFVSPIFLVLLVSIVILGLFAGKIENWNKTDALYWAFITATTVGYGDHRPIKKRSKLISVLIAFLGIIFTGFIVAVTVNTATIVIDKHVEPELKEKILMDLE
ncbi:MAG: potassium channel family protein [Opitutales bacterium]